MYYIEKIPLTNASFLSGSIAEPAPGETEWVAGTYAVGALVIRSSLHRTYRCAAARTASNTTPPELDVTSWVDISATKRWLPLGPLFRTDGKLVYQSIALTSTTEDIQYDFLMRYANSIALFGLRGVSWSVEVFANTTDTTPVHTQTGSIKAPATGYWDYAYGQRKINDRTIIKDLPIYPAARIRIKIMADGTQERRVSQIEVGKLRFIPGVDMSGRRNGGVVNGLKRSPRAYSYRKDEADGSSTTVLYGSTYDMSGVIMMKSGGEDDALAQLRALLGQGVAYVPTFAPGFTQSLVFGTLESGDTERVAYGATSINFNIRGLPTN